MTSDELKQRTKKFALRVIKLVENLPNNIAGKVLGNQVMRSATSVGANCRAAFQIKIETGIRLKNKNSRRRSR